MNETRADMEADPEVAPEVLKARFGRDIARDFDLDDPMFNDRFDEVLTFMVNKCPISYSKAGTGYHLVNTNEQVRRVAQDWRTFSSAKGYMPNRPEGLPYLMPEESDPPMHTNWRHKLNPQPQQHQQQQRIGVDHHDDDDNDDDRSSSETSGLESFVKISSFVQLPAGEASLSVTERNVVTSVKTFVR